MSERDGYIPGVPCWIDTTQPDPEAAADFYGDLFGWELEDVMPPGSRGEVLHRPPPRRGRRGRRLAPGGGAADGDVEHVRLGRQRRRDGREGARRRRQRAHGAVRRHGRRAHGGLRRPRRRRVLRLAGEGAQRRASRQRARLAELQRPAHARPRGREGVLRRRVRLGAARPRRRRQMWALPGYGDFLERATRACASRWPRWARPAGFEEVVASVSPIADDQPTAGALGRHLRRRRRRRHRRARPPSSAARWSSRRSTPRGCG